MSSVPEDHEVVGSKTEEDLERGNGFTNQQPSEKDLERDLNFQKKYQPQNKPKDYTPLQTLLLAYQSLGIVYGDIGTSPLYVLSSVEFKDPVEDDILGIFSLIFWTLTLIPLIKYVFIVLRADDNGEGGTFALYSFLCRHINFKTKLSIQNTRLATDVSKRFYTEGSAIKSKTKHFIESSPAVQNVLTFIVLLGTCMVIGDGALTPATSVLSALQGIQSLSTKITQNYIIMIAVVLLVILFLFQRFGTSKVGFTFSPIMLLWFATNTMIGIYNIFKYYPPILKALSPQYVFIFFSRNGRSGWTVLGAIFLCTTGGEAMFADLGHFNKRAIQLSFSSFVYPALVITICLLQRAHITCDVLFTGVVVIWVMIITTCLVTLVMLVIWDTNIFLIIAFFVPFMVIEGIFMTSLLNKIPQGGWVPFAISAFFLVIMLSWTTGRSRKSAYDMERKLKSVELEEMLLKPSLHRPPGICFFFTDLVNGIPPIIRHYIQHTSSVRKTMIIVTIRTLPIKSVLPEERLDVGKLGVEGLYRCLVQFGYKDSMSMEGDDFVASVVAKLAEIAESTEEAERLDVAVEEGVVFVTGRTILKSKKSNGWFDHIIIDCLYRFFQKNCRSAVASIEVPPGKTLQIGMLYEI
ncbi:Potassium transporter 6 [Camellia lanceoleosa]|uniref:Potassium transporter 6 n=1 Tax=Camellia lanceoleosa TaxID=1840588 RepID=A0ACC0IXB9_9ERIC|nr:Potassium transporter 6 [Camellia lanceoleosa]